MRDRGQARHRVVPRSDSNVLADAVGREVLLEAVEPEHSGCPGVSPRAARYREGTNLVKLDDDVAAMFPDERSVHEALLALVDVIHQLDKRHP
jgi:hypothetical protein